MKSSRHIGNVSYPTGVIDYQEFHQQGEFHSDQFVRYGEPEDIKGMVEYWSCALKLTPDGHPTLALRHADLGWSYNDQYRRLGLISDLEKSIECHSCALELTPDGHPHLSHRHAALGVSYNDRYRRLGGIEDLQKSVEHDFRALSLTPEGHPELSDRYVALGMSYTDRYRRLGYMDDLEQSTKCLSRALVLTSEDHPYLPSRHAALGVSHSDRYRQLGVIDDLEKSIECQTRALDLTPAHHPDLASRHTNLGVSYRDRYRRLKANDDLEKSMGCFSRALNLTPDQHPDLAFRHANLGVSYNDRYRQMEVIEDLEKAMECFSRALELTPAGHPDLPSGHAALGVSDRDRYRQLGAIGNMENSKAIEYKTTTLNLTTDAHPDGSNLAISYHPNGQYQRTSDPSHLSSSRDLFRKSSQLLNVASPRDAFAHALEWAVLASDHTYLNPIEAFRATIDLLPHFIWLGDTIVQKYQDLALADNVALQAASAAFEFSNYNLALEWLEHARCVAWNQTFMLRPSIDRPELSHPGHAPRPHPVSQRLPHASFGSSVPTSVTYSPEDRHHLAQEYKKLLAEVRSVPKFEDLLRPKWAARHWPVVVISCHKSQFEALLVLPSNDHVCHMALPNYTEHKLQHARSEIEKMLQGSALLSRTVRIKAATPQPECDIERVLADLWNDVVKPVLERLGYMVGVASIDDVFLLISMLQNNKTTDDLPHITWFPTGALTFLPLHAAGDYEQPGCQVFDHVISSYTPTLSALRASSPARLSGIPSVLAVAAPRIPGSSPLPGVIQELDCIKDRVRDKAEYAELSDQGVTPEAALDAMEKHDWVHIACHTHQDTVDSSKSGFLLYRGKLDVAAITQRSFRNKGLAYLSACRSAQGNGKPPGEMIHLGSVMLMVGYTSVIASMWDITDGDAPYVADCVYAQLMKDRKVGNGEAGKALHYAVAGLREKLGVREFKRWVQYVHIGS